MCRMVLDSLENATGDRCVDLFRREDGTFGFEEFRRDAEDGGLWHSLDRHGRLAFATESEARSQAKAGVAWLAAQDD